jgi:hypothetical protein
MAPAMDLESVIADITTSISPEELLTSLRSLVKLDVGESILASALPGGQDPLTVLDTHANTLGYLFILFVEYFSLFQFALTLSQVSKAVHHKRATRIVRYNLTFLQHLRCCCSATCSRSWSVVTSAPESYAQV